MVVASMNDKTAELSREYNQTNIKIWIAVLLSSIALVAAAYLSMRAGVITEPAYLSGNQQNLIFFGVILILAVLAFFKRVFLISDRIVDKARKHSGQILPSPLTSLSIEFAEKGTILGHSLILLRKYYLVIWSLTEAVVLAGFLVFIISLQLRSLLIFSFAGIYSLIINYPSHAMIERIRLNIFKEA